MESSQRKRSKWYRVKRVFALTQENATPVNSSMALQILLAGIASSFSMTYTFSFLPDMVMTFGKLEEDKGYYVGVISSAFFAGRIVGSYFWGWLSDKKGPKLVILINCVMMAAANLGFGFSVNVIMACVMRFLCGLPSGIVAVLKSVLRDLSDSTNQSAYLSIISLGWAIGMILGPFAGGYLSNPVKHYQQVFGDVHFLLRFPYLLACLLSAALFMLAFIIILFKWDIKHSDKRKQIPLGETEVEMKKVDKTDTLEADIIEDDATPLSLKTNRYSPTLKHNRHLSTKVCENEKPDPDANTTLISNTAFKMDDSNDSKSPKETITKTYVHESKTLERANSRLSVNDNDTRCGETRTVTFSNDIQHDVTSRPYLRQTQDSHKEIENDGLLHENEEKVKPSTLPWFRKMSTWNICRLLSMPTYRGSVAIYAITSFINIGFDALFSVWASTDVRFSGLNFEPHEIGRFVSIAALPLAVLQMYIYPKLEIRFGAKKVFIGFGYVNTLLMPLVAANRILLPWPAALWGCLLTIHALNVLAEAILFSSVTLFINNSVPVSIVGSANGMSMMAASLTRLFAPTVCGSVFAWSVVRGAEVGFPFDVNCMFIILGAMYWLCNCLCVMLPDSVNGRKKTAEKPTS